MIDASEASSVSKPTAPVRIHVGSASVAGGELNFDAARTFRGPAAIGVVVCDGVGTLSGSGEAATAVADRVASLVGGAQPSSILTSAEEVNRQLSPFGDSGEGSTTMIALAAGFDGTVAYSYLGNGSLLEVRPYRINPAGPPELRTAELTLPDVTYAEGRPALTSVLPVEGGEPKCSTGLVVARSAPVTAFLAVTDGIASDDERLIASDREGRVWRGVPEPLRLILGELADCWDELVAPHSDHDGAGSSDRRLSELLERSLTAMREAGKLRDDASAGVVLIERPVPS